MGLISSTYAVSRYHVDGKTDGRVLEKLFFCFRVFDVIDTFFSKYVRLRAADAWNI